MALKLAISAPGLALAGLLIVTTPPAQAGNESRSHAYAFSNDLVEVVADFSENSVYWCGAGTYAQNTLSKPATTMIYVWQGPSPSTARPGEKSVKFGFQPPPGVDPVSSLTTNVAIIGNALSVSSARQTCNERTTSG